MNVQFSNTEKSIAVLIDPDKASVEYLKKIVSQEEHFDYYFVGGSLISDYKFEEVIYFIKSNSDKPVILFPGHGIHVSDKADAILFLSLLSGRNPEYLIGQQVVAAPKIAASKIQTIPTSYLLIDGGNLTTAAYISNTTPIPADKSDIAICTALAGQMMGHTTTYLDCGSGANNSVSDKMLSEIRTKISNPIIIGGGIKSKDQIATLQDKGANIVVIGTALETDNQFFSR